MPGAMSGDESQVQMRLVYCLQNTQGTRRTHDSTVNLSSNDGGYLVIKEGLFGHWKFKKRIPGKLESGRRTIQQVREGWEECCVQRKLPEQKLGYFQSLKDVRGRCRVRDTSTYLCSAKSL